MGRCLELEKYIGKVGIWWIDDRPEEIFYATIVFINGNYVLTSEVIPVDIANTLFKRNHDDSILDCFTIHGKVEGTLFSMINSQASAMESRLIDTSQIEKGWECSIKIIPAEVVFGGFHANDDTVITSAVVNFENIDDFIHIKAFETGLDGIKHVSPESVLLHLDMFSIRLYSTLSCQSSKKSTTYINEVKTEFVFDASTSICNARNHISVFCMLLSLLKLNYISTPSIELFIRNTDNYQEVQVSQNLGYYHMNYFQEKIEEVRPMPFFLIQYEAIADIFENVVKRWYIVFEQDKPIIELFYQVLVKKSVDINKFLNLSQALEVYSNKYRKKQAKALVTKFPNNEVTNTSARLFHKIYDLLEYTNYCFYFSKNQINTVSRWITDTRNYYTHYGRLTDRALVKPEERSIINSFMVYLLVILVLNKLGIPKRTIKNNFYHTFYKSTLERIRRLLALQVM